MPVTQVIFVGHHKERLADSIRRLVDRTVSRIVIVAGQDQALPGEGKVWRIAKELKDELAAFWDVSIETIDKMSMLHAIEQLLALVKRERARGNDVLFNASGSLRTLAIAGYIVACMTGAGIVTSLPAYDEHDNETGISAVIDMPLIPYKMPTREQQVIMRAVGTGVDAMDELVDALKPGLGKTSAAYRNERSRVSHHLSNLEQAGMVTREKAGRNVRVSLTPLGKVALQAG